MPLTAVVDGARVAGCLLKPEEWAEMKAAIRASTSTATMPCGSRAIAKNSRLGTPFFAHAPGGDGCTAGESAAHLLAKAVIARAIVGAGWTAHIEHDLGDSVADVLAERDGQRIVFEVQWSRQSHDEYQRRQDRYRAAGVNAVAWFARHTAGLELASRDLPVFPLAIGDDDIATVDVGSQRITLDDTVTRLLSRRLQHREYYADGKPAAAAVEVSTMKCYRDACGQHFAVWWVKAVAVTGRCGVSTHRGRAPDGLFLPWRPEQESAIVAAVRQHAGHRKLRAANVKERSTTTSGTRYSAFCCPHCGAVSGDYYLIDIVNGYPAPQITCAVDPTAVFAPHWCLGGPEGLCATPPELPQVIAERVRAVRDDRGASVRVARADTTMRGVVRKLVDSD